MGEIPSERDPAVREGRLAKEPRVGEEDSEKNRQRNPKAPAQTLADGQTVTTADYRCEWNV